MSFGELEGVPRTAVARAPFRRLVAPWETWWSAHESHYEVGHRYYWGHRVPA